MLLRWSNQLIYGTRMSKILLLAASIRDGSCNKQLIKLIAQLSEPQRIAVETLDFAEFLPPLYDGNFEERFGLPETAQTFVTKLNSADALILSSPEYNFSTPGPLKNLIDWVSRAKPMPWQKYPIMLCSASPSPVGGNRGLLHTATVLQLCCAAYIFPTTFSLGNAYQAFASDGSLIDKDLEQRLAKNIAQFVTFVQALNKV